MITARAMSETQRKQAGSESIDALFQFSVRPTNHRD